MRRYAVTYQVANEARKWDFILLYLAVLSGCIWLYTPQKGKKVRFDLSTHKFDLIECLNTANTIGVANIPVDATYLGESYRQEWWVACCLVLTCLYVLDKDWHFCQAQQIWVNPKSYEYQTFLVARIVYKPFIDICQYPGRNRWNIKLLFFGQLTFFYE